MTEHSNLEKDTIYSSKVVGEKGVHRIKILSILEKTAVVELVDYGNKTAVVKIADIDELI